MIICEDIFAVVSAGGRLVGASAVFFFTKTAVTPKRKVENRSEYAKSTVSPRATNGPLTKCGVLPIAKK